MIPRRTRNSDVEAAGESDNDIVDVWPHNQAVIRMYGQGMGDCFLLALPRARSTSAAPMTDAPRPVFVLIDCGAISGTPQAVHRMTQIVRNIRVTTRDTNLPCLAGKPMGHLDLLIITNSHWNHISGFVQAAHEWEGIQVDEVWTSWAERPDTKTKADCQDTDDVTDLFHQIIATQQKALVQLADQARRRNLAGRLGIALGAASFLAEAQDGDGGYARAVGDVSGPGKIAGERASNQNWIRCEPGDVRCLPGTLANAYVLGPPRDLARLRSITSGSCQSPLGTGRVGLDKRSDKTTGKVDSEFASATSTAGLKMSSSKDSVQAEPDLASALRRHLDKSSSLNAVAMPLLALSEAGDSGADPESAVSDQDTVDRTGPFDWSVRVPLPTAEAVATTFPDTYGALASYFDGVNDWRRIDHDWLAETESFALEADNLTNNTSLVLAIELPPATAAAEAKILLFVSDAQEGSWQSWDEIPAWKLQDGVRLSQKQPDVADLLRRTVFYKVGHYGSDTATPPDLAIGRMRDDGTLISFVPTTSTAAKNIKHWSNLPSGAVLDGLSTRSGSRVVLADGTIWGCPENDLDAARHRIGVVVSTQTLKEARSGEVVLPDGPLWVQVSIAT